jgi:hypothetical protein
MLYTQENLLLLTIAGLFLFYIFRNVIIEGLTGNAPVELPLPKYLKRSEPTTLSEKDKARLDTCDNPPPSGMDPEALKRYNERCNMPTAYDDTETGYLLSPGTMNRLKSGQTVETNKDTRYSEATEDSKNEEVEILQGKIDVLTKEIEQLKKQMHK